MGPKNTRLVPPRRALHQRFRPVPRPERGLYPGEPENCRRDPRQFLAVLAHLGLLLAVFHVYHLEGGAFRSVANIAVVALPIHYRLPYRWKKPFFAAASAAGLAWIFGPLAAAVALAAGTLLIGACFLPVPWAARSGIVAALGTLFAIDHAGHGTGLVPDGVWPIVASMFMFRMILFLYELKHAERPETLGDAVGYFFLLPNYCFLHFPVVDYRTFRRGYFAGEVHDVQRSGLRMMTRGTLHLLLYRLIDHEWLVPADEVQGFAGLACFLVGNYLLYLRVSGQFHMACGMLHLFGFRLPETHHNYLLATGFTDYWRRVNIYWKDFMVRVVFNPVVFRLKRWPRGLALAAATLAVFVATWALHAYQSFWLRGTWGISAPDALFWGVLGLLVMVNVQLDLRASGRSARPRDDFSARGLAVRALKTAGTFVTIALLWSLWSSPSVGAWLGLLRRGFE